MPHYFSPHITDARLPHGPQTTDEKIDVFEDRVRGWQLDIADHACAIPDSGFAVLHILVSYFELIGLCVHGPQMQKSVPAKGGGTRLQDWGSRDYFLAGMQDVFPHLQTEPPQRVEKLLTTLYKNLRCGLYHRAMTGAGIGLAGGISNPIEVHNPAPGAEVFIINPKILVDALRAHFAKYVATLRDPSSIQERARFEQAFDG